MPAVAVEVASPHAGLRPPALGTGDRLVALARGAPFGNLAADERSMTSVRGRRPARSARGTARRDAAMPPAHASAAFASLETAEKLAPDEIERRARGLRDQLSLDEKISLMHGQLPLGSGSRR